MYSTLKLAGVAMIAIVLAIAIDPFRPPTPYGAGDPSPSPTAPPIDLVRSVPRNAALDAGATYVMDWGSHDDFPATVFTVPADGWMHYGEGYIGKADRDPLMGWWNVRNLTNDPCRRTSMGELDPPIGPSADDLASGLVEQAGGNASEPTDVNVGGYPARRLELSLPADLEWGACEGAYFTRWVDVDGTGGGNNLGDGLRNIMYIIDVEGSRILIDTAYLPETSAQDLAEAEQIIASMRFEPIAPGASPAVSPAT
jgi:hypothetical protein